MTQSFTQSADADGIGSPYTARSMTALRRRAAARLRAAAARQAAREADRARRTSEAAVKRSDLDNFDPDTPLEKLRWAREEMQRNFQQPMSARAMRVCTVCSERWDTAEDGGGDYRCDTSPP